MGEDNMVRATITLLNLRQVVRSEEVKPTIILLSAAVLPTIHLYFGSIQFAQQTLGLSDSASVMYMFACAFILLGIFPLFFTLFFKELVEDFGVRLGEWKLGLFSAFLLFIPIAALMLFPASQTDEIRAFYPFDKGILGSPLRFTVFEIVRGVLFYSAWEFFFRGFMLFGLRAYVGDWLAICIQTIPSCLWHIGMPTGEIFSSIAGGILFGLLALKTKSILWPLLLHYLVGVGLDFFICITA